MAYAWDYDEFTSHDTEWIENQLNAKPERIWISMTISGRHIEKPVAYRKPIGQWTDGEIFGDGITLPLNQPHNAHITFFLYSAFHHLHLADGTIVSYNETNGLHHTPDGIHVELRKPSLSRNGEPAIGVNPDGVLWND